MTYEKEYEKVRRKRKIDKKKNKTNSLAFNTSHSMTSQIERKRFSVKFEKVLVICDIHTEINRYIHSVH